MTKCIYGVDVVEWSRALDIRLSDWCCINGVSSNPVEGRTKILQLKDLILTLFGLIFRRIYTLGHKLGTTKFEMENIFYITLFSC